MATQNQDDLLLLFDSVEARYSTLIADFKIDDEYQKGDYGKGIIPEDWADEGLKDPIILTTITDAIDNAADHILTTPRITVPVRPVETKVEEARDHSEDKRQFLDMVWDHFFVNQGDPLGRGKRSMIKGKLVLKKEIDWRVIPFPPQSKTKRAKDKYRADVMKVGKTQFPWTLRVIPK